MKKYITIIILFLVVILQGCSGKNNDKQTSEQAAEVEDSAGAEDQETEKGISEGSTETIKEEATATSAAPTAAPTQAAPTPNPLVLPLITNDSGKVRIQTVASPNTGDKYNSYIITSINGESVVVDPTEMPPISVVDINPAAILVTHSHSDHTDSVFQGAYDCPQLNYTKGEIDTKDFHIYTILSSHSNDNIDGSNVIVVFEVDGIRIAHMGDIGQTALTEEQLKELGEIDIAFMQFENNYSNMSLGNKKGFTLIEQLNPKIIIPTHYSGNALLTFKEKYGMFTDYDNVLEISKDELPEKALTVYRILNSHKYQ